MPTPRHGYALILSIVCGLLSLPARAQSQTSSTAADGEDEPGRPRPPERREHARAESGGGSARIERDDHEAVIGHFGVGWFGVSNILVGFSLDGSTGSAVVAAPVLGIRYWLSELIGIDGGIGIGITGSSASVEAAGMTTSSDGPSSFGLLLHGGVPLALTSGRHYAFIVVPEINVGFASVTRQMNMGGGMMTAVENTGFRFDIGARAGAEVQFGFIGVPDLALEASVGLYLTRIQARQEISGVTQRVGQTSLSTTQINNPWDFFLTSVAARYYF